MNDAEVGSVADRAGYSWPTRNGPRTHQLGRLDHIFLKGLPSPDSAAAGTITDSRGVSDHRPVWAVALVESK